MAHKMSSVAACMPPMVGDKPACAGRLRRYRVDKNPEVLIYFVTLINQL